MSPEDKILYLKIGYFTSIASGSLLFGFSLTLKKLKKSSPESKTAEDGIALARKALIRGTVYALCGFGLFSFVSYQLFGKRVIANFNSAAATKL